MNASPMCEPQAHGGLVEAHFDGPIACGSGQAASQACFPQLGVPFTLVRHSAWAHAQVYSQLKVRQQKLAGKVMLIVFFDHWGPLYPHFVPPSTTINKEYYLEVSKIFWRHVNRKCLELKNGRSCTRITYVAILHDWCKNTSKTPMLNCHLILCTC